MAKIKTTNTGCLGTYKRIVFASLLITPLGYLILHTRAVAVVVPHNRSDAPLSLPSHQRKYGDLVSASQNKEVNMSEYHQALASRANEKNVIILALIDSSFMEMALNFYETSIVKFSITNYLFLSSDHQACNTLAVKGVACYLYMPNANAAKTTVFGTKEFKEKMNIRTYMILDALQMGFTVLHTDIDVVFLKNPLDDIKCTSGCDLATLWDSFVYNAGFMYIRPTERSLEVYQRMVRTAKTTNLDDQNALNAAIRDIRKRSWRQSFYPQKLSTKQYMCGKLYFEDRKHYFAGVGEPCDECVVVHNNWIVSMEAKRYRFRELHMWLYDGNMYYTDPSRKYITYSNPAVYPWDEEVQLKELTSLKTALFFGSVLNRTVILPRFHCRRPAECPLNSLVKISNFDAVFGNMYRESSFLTHPKVPESVISQSTNPDITYWMRNESDENQQNQQNNIYLKYKDKNGPSRQEILDLLSEVQSPVLKIGSFEHLFGNSSIPEKETSFGDLLKKAFLRSSYRQLKPKNKKHRPSQ